MGICGRKLVLAIYIILWINLFNQYKAEQTNELHHENGLTSNGCKVSVFVYDSKKISWLGLLKKSLGLKAHL